MATARKHFDAGQTDEGIVFGCLVGVMIGKMSNGVSYFITRARKRSKHCKKEMKTTPNYFARKEFSEGLSIYCS